MKRIFLFCAYAIVFPVIGYTQTVCLDSVGLFKAMEQRITKVAFAENDTHMAVAWLGGDNSQRIYFQVFTKNGIATSDTVRLYDGIFGRVDVDVEIDNEGQVVVAWASPSVVPYGHQINYRQYTVTGQPVGAVQQLAPQVQQHLVRLSKNASGEILVGWKHSNRFYFQLLNADGSLNGNTFFRSFYGELDIHSFPVALADDGRVLMTWFANQIAQQLLVLFEPGNNSADPATACCLESYNVDTDKEVTATVYGRRRSEWFAQTGTYLSLSTTHNATDRLNFIQLDPKDSRQTFVDMDEKGFLVAWRNWDGETKLNYHLRSGAPVDDPILLSSGNIISMDVNLAGDMGTVVYAHSAEIRMRRFYFNGRKESPERSLFQRNTAYYNRVNRSITNGRDRHVVFWQYNEYVKSAVFAQRLDENFQPLGDVINITDTITHENTNSDFLDFDAAMDSVGNFMVAWKRFDNVDIYARKYSWDGTILIDNAVVNEYVFNKLNYNPRVAANDKGTFLVTWNNESQLKGRLCREVFEGNVVKMGAAGSQPKIFMNDAGAVVYVRRNGYDEVACAVYNKELQFTNGFTKSITDPEGSFDVALTNAGHVILAATRSDGIRLQKFTVSGSPLTSQTLITGATNLRGVRVDTDSAGGFTLAYQKEGIMVQKFDENGIATEEAFRVSTFREVVLGTMSYTDKRDVLVAWGHNGVVFTKAILGDHCSLELTRISATIEEGFSYDFYTQALNKPGKYAKIFQNPGQCSSAILLTLTQLPNQPPAVPRNFSALAGDLFIDLNWDPNTEADLKGYIIYRNTTDSEQSSIELTRTSENRYHDKNVVEGQQYYYWLKAQDVKLGTSERTAFASAIPVNMPPSAPSGVVVTTTEYEILVSWTPGGESDLKEYHIYRSSGGGPFTLFGTSERTTITDGSAADATPYEYKVYSVDKSENVSDASDVVSGARQNLKPSPPSDIAANVSIGYPEITWKKPAEPDVTSFRIFRSSVNDNSTPKQVAETTGESFVDDKAMPGTNFYWIRAVDKGGLESDFSTVTEVSIDANLPPAAPDNVTLASGSDYITITWNANTENDLKEYHVHRSKGGNAFTFLRSVVPATITDVDVDEGTDYAYKIYALDQAGNRSEASAVVSGIIHLITGLEPQPGASISAYPNPTTGEVYFDRPISDYSSIRLFDSRGRVLFLNNNDLPIQSMSLGHFPPGIYTLQVTDRAANPAATTIRLVLIR